MMTTTAATLIPGDEFTTDGGETWRRVHNHRPLEIARTEGGQAVVFGRDADGKRFWLWANEEVVVR